MSFLDRTDMKFVRRFCDLDQRKSLLDGLSFRTHSLFWGACFAVGSGGLIGVFGAAPAWNDLENPPLAFALSLATFVLLVVSVLLALVQQSLSERLLLLRVIDQLQRERDTSSQHPNTSD